MKARIYERLQEANERRDTVRHDAHEEKGQSARPKFYTPRQIAEMLQISDRTVLDAFREEPGTIRIANQKPGRRARTLIRIPAAVFDVWISRHQVK